MRTPVALFVGLSMSFLAACAGNTPAASDASRASTCASGTDSDGNACEARQGVAEATAVATSKDADASVVPPALAALLAPDGELTSPKPGEGEAAAVDPDTPHAELGRLSVDKMYRAACDLEAANNFDGARAIYGDILSYFPSSPRAVLAQFQMGEMYLKEGLAFGAYLSDAADAYATVSEDPRADPALVAFALMRLEQTTRRMGNEQRAGETEARLEHDFPKSEAMRALRAKTR